MMGTYIGGIFDDVHVYERWFDLPAGKWPSRPSWLHLRSEAEVLPRSLAPCLPQVYFQGLLQDVRILSFSLGAAREFSWRLQVTEDCVSDRTAFFSARERASTPPFHHEH